MAPPYQVVVYPNEEKGFVDKQRYQTLAEAEQAAQKYVDGVMEGESDFAYEGAAVYDIHENRWLCVFRNFPNQYAIEQAAQALSPEEQAELQPLKERMLPQLPKRPRRERVTFAPLHPEIPREQRHDFISLMTPWGMAHPAKNMQLTQPPSVP